MLEVVYALVIVAAFLAVAAVGGMTAYRLYKGED
jgi:hypothetical protein